MAIRVLKEKNRMTKAGNEYEYDAFWTFSLNGKT